MEMNLDTRTLIESLKSNLCPACGGKKHTRNTLCFPCYRKLSMKQRRALYSLVREGYEQAFADAMQSLGVELPYFPEMSQRA